MKKIFMGIIRLVAVAGFLMALLLIAVGSIRWCYSVIMEQRIGAYEWWAIIFLSLIGSGIVLLRLSPHIDDKKYERKKKNGY